MKIASMLAVAGVLLFAAGGVQAMPIAPAPIASTDEAPLILARAGCGFGAHRGPFGGCRLNQGPRGAIRGAITGAPGGCPPGLYRGPYGGCRRRF